MKFIEGSANKCSAAWKIIKKVTTPSLSRVPEVTPDQLNEYFVETVQSLREEMEDPGVSALELLERCPSPTCRFEVELASCDQVLDAVKDMKTSRSRNLEIRQFKRKLQEMLLAHPLYALKEFFEIPTAVVSRCF
ncbi:uncharacterized protein LOC129004914 [Macrosteles quadrilineatus]|nr:uncharacterized protein LOC128982473 [Macrosteles quadrilineatus]XP_054257463.1 uncharacterized protein LOC128982533 [Macrosteles quadrilineatus]XP_054275060.1 uncharacterized protein LOC128994495 [Macrosteles quadrilineatus]XP_054289595.1 uncharacterized protein LOC129004914 [Macrosteles quadrilineatus]